VAASIAATIPDQVLLFIAVFLSVESRSHVLDRFS